ncbi:hypothetical protein D3C87_1603390 [compost metagenome]
MTNQDRFFTTTAGAGDFHMNFGHQRTGRVKHGEIATFCFVTNRLRHTVRGENQDRAVGHFADLLDKDRSALTQAFNHIAVVHHFVTHINRRAVDFQRVFNNADSAVNAGAKTARVSQQDLHLFPPVPDRSPALQHQNERYARQADG